MKPLIGLIAAIFVIGCMDQQEVDQRNMELNFDRTTLPEGATNPIYRGNYYHTFEWKGQCFLHRRAGASGGNAEITVVPEEICDGD